MHLLLLLLADLFSLTLPEVEIRARQAEIAPTPYRVVTTIESEEIATLPITTVADVLRYLPGVDVRARGASGAQVDVSMRGGTFDQVQIMINGVNLTDTHTGHYSMNLPLSPLLVSRIEVLQGTTTELFGLNAFSGAINIVTKDPTNSLDSSLLFIGQLAAGMNGLVQPDIALRASKKGWYINTAVEYARANGYTAPEPTEKERIALSNSDYRIANIYLQTGWQDWDVQVGAQYKDIGAGMFYGFGSQDQFDATRTGFASLKYAHRWGQWSLDAQASYRTNYDHYEWHRGQQANSNTHFTHNAAASCKGHYLSEIGTTTVGLELRDEYIQSTSLKDTLYPNGLNRMNVNYCLGQTFHYRSLSASIGVGGNYNTYCGHHMTGEMNIGYQYVRSGNVYLNVNRSLRLPTFTDLYYDAGNQLGNKDLQPESAWTFTIGNDYTYPFGNHSGSLFVHGAVYYRLGRNAIDWVFVPEDTRRPYHAANMPQTQTAGVETELSYRWIDWLPYVGVRYAYTYTDMDYAKAGSRYLNPLTHHVVFRVNHAFFFNRRRQWVLGGDWSLRYMDRAGQYNNDMGRVCDYAPVLLLDGAVYWKNSFVCVRAECTNMTNRHYYDYGGVLQPGAWLKGVITVRL